jgi:hypothetical protein
MPSLRGAALSITLGVMAWPAGADPITWNFAGEITFIHKGSFDPGFPLGRVVEDEFVPTAFDGFLTFDPAEAVLWDSSRPEGGTDDICLPTDWSCSWLLPGIMVVHVDGHMLTLANPTLVVLQSLMWNFSFTSGGFRYDEEVFPYFGVNLHVYNRDVDVTLVEPMRLPQPAGGHFGFTVWPDLPETMQTQTSVSGRVNSMSEVPEPSILVLLLVAISGVAVDARKWEASR